MKDKLERRKWRERGGQRERGKVGGR